LWVLVDRVHAVIALYGYNNGGAVMTLVLPLGFFIVVMIALYFVFSRPHTVPGRRPITGARPVAPSSEAAAPIAAAGGFPTSTSAGGTEPLTERVPPPAARGGEAAEGSGGSEAGDGAATGDAADSATTATGDTASDEPTLIEKPEETE
jgi:hypothetical protein